MTALLAYCAMSLLVLGHYNYAPLFDISFKIHLFIWIEAILAMILAVYGVLYVWQFKIKEKSIAK
nr:hypothetical protein [uncultured Moraxella sp.]